MGEGPFNFSVRVSPFIGLKVFLNYISNISHTPPTKNVLFFYNPEEKEDDKMLLELKTKGTCTLRILDYGIKEGSIVAVKQQYETSTSSSVRTEVEKYFGIQPYTTKEKNVTIDSNYFDQEDDEM